MDELARLLLLLAAVALVINLIKHGGDGVKKWLAAKFLGRNAPASYLAPGAGGPHRQRPPTPAHSTPGAPQGSYGHGGSAGTR